MNWRSVLVAVALVVGSFSVVDDGSRAGGQLSDSELTVRETVVKNTQRITELEHDVRALEAWRETHSAKDFDATEKMAAEHRELQVTVAHQEQMIIAIALGVLGILTEITVRWLAAARKKGP